MKILQSLKNKLQQQKYGMDTPEYVANQRIAKEKLFDEVHRAHAKAIFSGEIKEWQRYYELQDKYNSR